MKKIYRLALVPALLACVVGCASLMTKTARETDQPRYVYPGAQLDLGGMVFGAAILFGPSDPFGFMPRSGGAAVFALTLVDLPLSLAVDTVCLPYDLWMMTGGGRTRKGLPRPELATVRNRQGKTQLMLAAEKGDLRRIDRLLEQGADVDARDIWGATALICAARGWRLDTVERLVQRGADVNAADAQGMTPLMWAARGGADPSEMVQLLVRLGADVHRRDKAGQTARGAALRNGNRRVADLLVELGAPSLPEDESLQAAMREAVLAKDGE